MARNVSQMSDCFLTATGIEFDVDKFIDCSEWRGLASIFHRGEETGLRRQPHRLQSGLQVDISCVDDNIETQIQAALLFLKKNESELQRLKTFPDIEEIVLKMALFWYSDTLCKVVSLSPEFSELTARHNVKLDLCIYATSSEPTPILPA